MLEENEELTRYEIETGIGPFIAYAAYEYIPAERGGMVSPSWDAHWEASETGKYVYSEWPDGDGGYIEIPIAKEFWDTKFGEALYEEIFDEHLAMHNKANPI